MFDLELMRRLSDAIMSEDEVRSARDGREYEEGSEQPLEGRKPTHTVPQLSDDALRDLVSPEAQDAIVGFEVTSKAAYEKRYLRPIAPAGDSGVTVGIGYDLGYNTPESVRRDFGSLLSGSDVELLVRATGLKGNSARQRLPEFQGVIVPWEAAIAVFKRTTLPKFAKAVLETFPNTVELKGHAFGALTSLVYNRGTRLDGDRRREMAAIHDLLSNRHFNQVAAQIRGMTRLWEGQANLGGVVKRRLAEAILFEQGLEQMKRPVAVASAETQRFESKSTTAEIIASLEGDGTFYVEEPDTGAFRESATWSKVTWAEDAKSPDYRHITRVPADVALIGRTFEIGPAELELLFRANAFEPSRSYGRVIFALRGAELVTSLTSPQRMERQEGQEKLTLRDVRPDHKSSRCIIGVYDVDRQHLSAYAGSTVPNRRAVALHVEGKMRANMIPTGCYRFELGWHQWSEAERRIPGCLIEAGRTKCVIRSSNDYMYGVDDEWDNAAPCGDNLHPAKSDTSAPFSSFGCLVVAGNVDPSTGGDRANVKHTGDWARFRRAMGFAETGTAGHGREYDVVLLTGLDAAIAHSLVAGRAASDDGQVLNRIGRLRQGSRGDRVRRIEGEKARPLRKTADRDPG